jgi:hypothetical protein
MKNLVNRLLDPIKRINLFTQECMNVEEHNKPNGCSVRYEKNLLLRHYITIYDLQMKRENIIVRLKPDSCESHQHQTDRLTPDCRQTQTPPDTFPVRPDGTLAILE